MDVVAVAVVVIPVVSAWLGVEVCAAAVVLRPNKANKANKARLQAVSRRDRGVDMGEP